MTERPMPSPTDRGPRALVDPSVAERFPGYRGIVVYASRVTNGPSNAESDAMLSEAEAAVRVAFGQVPASSHPHVAAWRAAFSAFGSKPSRYLSSVEGLLKRVLRGEAHPRINRMVDAYNAVSIAHVLPLGGEDRTRLAGDVHLTIATGAEPFDDPTRPGTTDHPDPGEVVWADPGGVTCRRWNWRQCLRTRLTEATTEIYFILDSLEPYPREDLTAAAADLAAHLRALSPNCRVWSEPLPGPPA
jgi:DNA/RNA-binding domain of Phe-tRNA-synthetase-like protein